MGIGLHSLQAVFEKKAVLSKVVVATVEVTTPTTRERFLNLMRKGSWNWLGSESCGDPQSSIQQQRCYPVLSGTLPVEGLESNKDYFVSKIDNKTFQTVEVGIGSTAEMSSGIRTS